MHAMSVQKCYILYKYKNINTQIILLRSFDIFLLIAILMKISHFDSTCEIDFSLAKCSILGFTTHNPPQRPLSKLILYHTIQSDKYISISTNIKNNFQHHTILRPSASEMTSVKFRNNMPYSSRTRR